MDNEETKNIILLFDGYNSMQYWYCYMLSYLNEKGIRFKSYMASRSVIFNNQVVKFMTVNPYEIQKYKRGRRNISTYAVENIFEDNFEGAFNKLFKI